MKAWTIKCSDKSRIHVVFADTKEKARSYAMNNIDYFKNQDFTIRRSPENDKYYMGKPELEIWYVNQSFAECGRKDLINIIGQMEDDYEIKAIITELLDWLENEHMGLAVEFKEYINKKYNFDLNKYLSKKD